MTSTFYASVRGQSDLAALPDTLRQVSFDCIWRSQTPVNGCSVICLGVRTTGEHPSLVGSVVVEDEKLFPAVLKVANLSAHGLVG